MSACVLFVYGDEETADRVLLELRASGTAAGDLGSASVVRVAEDGAFTVTTTDTPGHGRPFWGILWEALFALVFLVPAARSSYGPNLGGLFGAIDRGGIDADVRGRIRDAFGPRTSALGVFLREAAPGFVSGVADAHGGTMVEVPLSLEADSELAAELGAITVSD